jgi:hypothetical protein
MIQYFPIVTGSLTVLGNINVSGSITTSGSITISGSITSASFATSASNATNAISASYANNLTVAGTLTAQTIVVQTITSSVDYITGSSINGSKITDTHQFTGSIYTSGSIGIGTNSPGQPLELYVADGNGIRLKNSGSADKRWDIVVSGNDFKINEVGVTAVMTIKAGGNIGIGTTSPNLTGNTAPNLTIVATSTTSGGVLELASSNLTSTTGELGKIEFLGLNGSNTIQSRALIVSNQEGTTTSSNMRFFTMTGGTVGERMRIDSAGCLNVGGIGGIGKLDVCGQASGVAVNICRIGNIAGVNNGLIISVNSSNNYSYSFGTLGTGTVSATSGVLSASSDKNLKNDDGGIENALSKVLQLNPRYFHWKEESGLPTDIRQLGFYAQDVNAALGEEVANTPKDEHDKWGIYDRALIAMLTKAIQELNTKFEEYKATHP